jgi:hypothetical protein
VCLSKGGINFRPVSRRKCIVLLFRHISFLLGEKKAETIRNIRTISEPGAPPRDIYYIWFPFTSSEPTVLNKIISS